MKNMNKKIQLSKYKEYHIAVRDILNEYDFLQVVPEGVKNEYEDLINPILKALFQNPSKKDLSELIGKLIADGYGLHSTKPDLDVAEEILGWWNDNQKK
ncbi:MAG TPA: hypothetical protein VM077_02040 [Candidatus Limnocylindrales bacterium]|nr:hypothetical protein [Candidatus Limnocylindrales bacterium]